MKKVASLVVVLIIVAGIMWFVYRSVVGESAQVAAPNVDATAQINVDDYLNNTYVIENESIMLQGGRAVTDETTVTQYFGNDVTGDLNGDGMTDVAFILVQNSGGSGTFYYVVASVRTLDGYRGTNAIFLGDRIAPQTTEIRDGVLIVNYADRKQGEPMTVRPSVGVSKYLKVEGTTLVGAR